MQRHKVKKANDNLGNYKFMGIDKHRVCEYRVGAAVRNKNKS